MKNIIKKIPSMIGKSVLWVFAIFLLFVIVSQISLWLGLQWLNSDKGEAWTKDQINIALKDSNYNIDFKGFRYQPLSKLLVKNLEISDAEGTILTTENAKVSINVASIAMRNLSLELTADQAILHRLPETEAPTKEPPKAFYLDAISLPDVYFNKLEITKVAIKKLEIKEAVAGQPILLSPLLSGGLDIASNMVNIDLSFQPDVLSVSTIALLPGKAEIKASFDSDKSILDLQAFEINSDAYNVLTKGRAVLREAGDVNFTTSISSDSLDKIHKDMQGRANAEIVLGGQQDALNISANGKVSMSILNERGLSDVIFEGQSKYSLLARDTINPVEVSVKSSYQEIPVELKTLIEKSGSIIKVSKIQGTAPDVSLKGAIDVDLETSVATGEVSATVEKFSRYRDLLQLDVGGKGNAVVKLSANTGKQQADVNIAAQSVKYQDLTVKSVKASALFPTIENIFPTKADWVIDGLKTGGVELKQMSGSLKGKDGGVYALQTKGRGNLTMPFSFDGTADIIDLKTPKPSAQNIKTNVKLNGQNIVLNGKVNQETIDMTIQGKAIKLKELVGGLPEGVNRTSLNGDVKIKGAMANPVITTDVDLSAFSVGKKLPQIKIDMQGGYQNNQATVNLKGSGEGVKALNANVNVPMTIALYPFQFDLPTTQSLNGKATFNLEVSKLSKIFLPPNLEFSGLLESNFDIQGSIAEPRITGVANLSQSAFSDDTTGLNLLDLKATTLLQNDRVVLQSLTAKDDKNGSLAASGSMGINNFVPQNVDMSLDVKDFHLLDGDLADGTFNGDLKFSGSKDLYNLTGSVRPNYIDVTIPEKLVSNIPELNIVEVEGEDKAKSILSKIKVAIDFIADNKIFVRGWGLDAEFGGRLKIDGNLDDPNFDGVLKAERGRYTEFGKRFELTTAELNFLGRIPANPVLNIVAETEVDDITAQVNFKGNVQDPKISFSSNPTLPEDEVLARILFGRDLASISPFQAIQLTQTLRRFSGKGSGFDPLGEIRSATGLDDLRVDSDENGETTVGAGKYLTDKVYLEFEKGSGENSGAANLEVEVTPNITLESEVGQDAQAGAGLFWEWDY